MILDLDHWREIKDALAANKTRTALTAFGVFWAIFMLLIMLGAGNGLRNGATQMFSGTATNSFFIWTQGTSKPYKGLPARRNFEFDISDVEWLKRMVPEIDIVAPRSQLNGWMGGNSVQRGIKAGGFSVFGDVPEATLIQPLKIELGRFLNPNDLLEKRKVAIIGPKVREILFAKDENPLGENIWVKGVAFQVIGTFTVQRSGGEGDRDSQSIYVPLTTYQQAFNEGTTVGWLSVTAEPGLRASVVEEKVLAMLARRHDVAPDDKRAFGHWNMEKEFAKIQGVFLAIKALTWIVGIGTLAAGAIGVSNVMLVIVRERTREIGIRRAIGATPFSVQSQIILESVLLTTMAGYLGLVGGVAIIEVVAIVVNKLGPGGMFKNPEVSLTNGVQALVILIVAGALAGLIPARRATAVRPVDALRGTA